MRILFCDDNLEILNQLQKYVSEFFKELGGKQPEYAAYLNGDSLLRNEQFADIAFLDVEMPGRSGIHVGAKLKESNPRIKIFIVTSFPDYLDEAMRFQVFRYLSKPIDKNRLFRNLKDALYQYNIDSQKISINTSSGLVVLPSDEIVCFESDQRKVLIYTTDEIIQTTDNIEYWRKTLSLPCFFSTYRSYIVNMKFVFKINKDSVELKYGDMSKTAYLARRKYTEFKDTYLLYLESMR